MRIIRFEASAHRGTLHPSRAGSPSSDLIRFTFTVSGAADTTSSGRRSTDLEGSARILLPSTSLDYHSAASGVILIVEAPVTTLPALIGRLVSGLPGALIRPNALTAATIAFVNGALDVPVDARSDDVYHIERALAALLTAMATSAQEDAEAPTAAAADESRSMDDLVFERAMAIIREELTDPELGLPLIADRLGTSSRSLQRVFAKHDVSVSESVRDARLDALASRLAEPGSTRALGAASREVGFGAVDYARRAFLKRFGVSMTQYRAGERRG